MIAYKGFEPGLVCRNYQFQMGLNVTDKANCRQNGFHCAEDPLDCLNYYGDLENSEYWLVDANGDVNEDGDDSKISCTELTIIKQLTKMEFFIHALAFMVDHPKREWSSRVVKNKANAYRGYAVVRGRDPVACGNLGDILAFAKEDAHGNVIQIALTTVDGDKIKPDVWYGVELTERTVSLW